MTPLLSVVLPVYNGEKYLPNAIDSILNQSFRDFELIIVDDGSTDRTKDIIASYTDQRIIRIINNKNEGIVHSRNAGLRLARGKYYAPFDADDVAHPSKFERQITFLENHPEYSMIGSYAHATDAQGKKLPHDYSMPASPECIPPILLFRNYFIQSSIVARRAAMPVNGYEEGFEIGEDWLMWVALSKKGKVGNIPAFLVSKREHSHNAGSSNQEKLVDFDKKVYKKIFQDIGIQLDQQQLHLLVALKYSPSRLGGAEVETLMSILTKMKRNPAEKMPHLDQSGLSLALANRWLKLTLLSNAGPMQKWKWFFISPFLKTWLSHPIQTWKQ